MRGLIRGLDMRAYGLLAVLAIFALVLAATAVPVRAGDLGGGQDDDEVVQAIKKFKPFIAAYAGASAAYGDGKFESTISSFFDASDGGFNAAALVGGAVGFTSKFKADGPWYWGVEVSGERRLTSEDSTAVSQYFKGGDTKWTLGAAAILGVEIGAKAKAYMVAGWRKGWADDIVSPLNTYNAPDKGGPEAGLGLSYNFNKNLVWFVDGRMWFPDAESVEMSTGTARFESKELTVRTGLKLEF